MRFVCFYRGYSRSAAYHVTSGASRSLGLYRRRGVQLQFCLNPKNRVLSSFEPGVGGDSLDSLRGNSTEYVYQAERSTTTTSFRVRARA